MAPIDRLTRESADTALEHLRINDLVLANVIERIGPFRFRRQTNRYQVLLRSIIAQQISGAAAKTIWNRVAALAAQGQLTPESVDRMSDDQLRGAGLSPQKLKYVRDLNRHVLARELQLRSLHRASDEDVIDQLTQVKGIGLWTAQMFLMFSLGRPDVLPHGDLGIRAAIRKLYALEELPDRETCHGIALPWRPFATVACWYLWRTVEETDDWE